MKIFKAIVINAILLIVLGGITVGFFYGWKYYKAQYDQEKEEYQEELVEANSLTKFSLLIGEKYFEKKNTKWSDIYFIDDKGEQKFDINIAHDVSVLANPQATQTNLFYYEPGEKKESLDHMILWAADFKGASENKIAAFSKDYYPQGIWMSPDYSTVSYMRSYDNGNEHSYWVFHNENGVARELISPASNLNPVPYRGFNGSGSLFYYFEKIDDNDFRLNQAKIQGSIISPAFRGVEWKNIDWEDLWEVKPIAITATGNNMIYLDKKGKEDFVETTEIKKVSEAGEFSSLVNLYGNIYEIALSLDDTYIAYNHIYYNDNEEIERITVEVIESDGDKPEIIYETSQNNLIYDIHWGNNGKYLYFVDNNRGSYSEIIKLNIESRESEVIYRREADKNNDYIKILQTIEIPKDLAWRGMNEQAQPTEVAKVDLDKIFEYISDNIEKLAFDQSNNDNAWNAYKIGYITDNDYYVEYTNDSRQRRLLLSCNQVKNKIECDTIASYKPFDYQWKIVEGEDKFSKNDVIYYEFWDDQWSQSYSSSNKEVFPFNNEDIIKNQRLVDQGDEQWRLDPVKVVQRELPNKYGFTDKDRYDLFLSEDGEARVKVESNGDEYEIKLFQLVKEGEGGVWTIVRIKII